MSFRQLPPMQPAAFSAVQRVLSQAALCSVVKLCCCVCACVQADPRRIAKAEKAKAQGNDAFKQQKYRWDWARHPWLGHLLQNALATQWCACTTTVSATCAVLLAQRHCHADMYLLCAVLSVCRPPTHPPTHVSPPVPPCREAIKAYSEASKLDPTNPVYLSNRALCYLKVFRWGTAHATQPHTPHCSCAGLAASTPGLLPCC